MIPLWQRLSIAKKELEPVQSQYRVVFEDPNSDTDEALVMIPDPNWMACALHGGILPPLWVYEELAKDEAEADFVRHTRGHLLHETEPMGPMTEEEAIEYLIRKDLPKHVWMANDPKMKICRADSLPDNREFRSAWRLVA